MVPMLSELWRLAEYLARPESELSLAPARTRRGALLMGAAKALLWAGVSVLAGLALGRLS
ncbi:MAG: hypothetical protein HY916_09630 [Desulfovibrio sp.]|jgi:hypothetical protein|nr:hypothetical protein [Desulfovibrio sp.]